MLDTGVAYEVVRKSGAWYYWGEEKLGQGKEGAREYLKANPDLFKKIDAEIREKAGLSKGKEKSEPAPKEAPAKPEKAKK